ncbi:hypothetical protein VOLCADRAFT_106511 [Volvox carteri f. nagariensis]|uniref:MOSC domain-containing protein n=1 Tax=Volvox carteri f. nagariensis TaxID=3068 RepID=D8U800_VOLCA|nr:uncharacterized protein VOLCADRAFT_106511 [Volvox carteri f. nagariensis]EFJ44131.1 hypothetical protein VOLCADRAFT_106511 [Volvox carteri f. nagariensis]|eukprot:XP_002954725.1 hypothetical protein VOLCADRAFT_106511 [Volvox carteri f. nagariensis]
MHSYMSRFGKCWNHLSYCCVMYLFGCNRMQRQAWQDGSQQASQAYHRRGLASGLTDPFLIRMSSAPHGPLTTNQVVREDTGKFISQREKELLALVEVALAPEALIAAHSGLSQLPPGSVMTVTAPGMDEPLQIPLGRRPNCDTRKVTVWEWTGLGEDEGADAASWFSRYLGVPCRLVRYLGSSTGGSSTGGSSTGGSSTGGSSTGGATEQPRAQQQQQAEAAAAGIVGASSLPYMRTTEPEYAVGYETRFSDGYPMLLVTQAALAALNAKLAEPLPMNRFRPNIEVAGADPWAEDGWRDMEVQSSSAPFPSDGPTLRLTAVKPCSRCKVTTINQDTARVGDEPLEALGTFRLDRSWLMTS